MRATIRNGVRCIFPPKGRYTVAALPLVTFGGNPFQDGPRISDLFLHGGVAIRGTALSALQRQAQAGHTARTVGPILQRKGAAVAFGDLAAEHEADAAASRLGGRSEEHTS